MTKKWKNEDSKTLTDLHLNTQYNRILYKKAGNFFKRINKISGIVGMVCSSIALSITWINENNNENIDALIFNTPNNISLSNICNDDSQLLKTLLSFTLITTFSQNIFNFSDTANEYFNISKSYGIIQSDLEIIGDIHPNKRNGDPKYLLPKLRYRTNKLNQNSKDVPTTLSKLLCYTSNKEGDSYLVGKHERYKSENEDEEEEDDDYSFDRIHHKDINIHGFENFSLTHGI